MQLKLSPSSAAELQNCPLAFREKYLSVVRPPRFTPNPAAGLGNNLHHALETFYKRGGHSALPLPDFLEEKWDGAGFGSRREEQEYMREARRLLANYYRDTAGETSGLKRYLERYGRLERVVLGRHRLALAARFDRVELFRDGAVEIIDYKSGSPAGGLPDRLELAESFASLVYYRLARHLFPAAPRILVSHYYLRSRKKVTLEYTLPMLERARGALEKVLDRLEKGEAPALPNSGCPYCPVAAGGKCPLFKSAGGREEPPEF